MPGVLLLLCWDACNIFCALLSVPMNGLAPAALPLQLAGWSPCSSGMLRCRCDTGDPDPQNAAALGTQPRPAGDSTGLHAKLTMLLLSAQKVMLPALNCCMMCTRHDWLTLCDSSCKYGFCWFSKLPCAGCDDSANQVYLVMLPMMKVGVCQPLCKLHIIPVALKFEFQHRYRSNIVSCLYELLYTGHLLLDLFHRSNSR